MTAAQHTPGDFATRWRCARCGAGKLLGQPCPRAQFCRVIAKAEGSASS